MKCIIIDDDPISQTLLKGFVRKTNLLNCIAVFNNPTEAQDIIENKTIDIIFLDIEMPEMSGFDFLESKQNLPQIIVVSGSKKHALNSFEYDVTDYLLKPFSFERFLKSVNKSVERYIDNNSRRYDNSMLVKKKDSYCLIKINDITALEFCNDGLGLNTDNDLYMIKNSLDIDFIINKEEFIPINNQITVNVNRVIKLNEDCIDIMLNGNVKSVPIEKEFSANLKEKFKSRK